MNCFDDIKAEWVKNCLLIGKTESFILRELKKSFDEKLIDTLSGVEDTKGDVSNKSYTSSVRKMNNLWNSLSTMLVKQGIHLVKDGGYKEHLMSKPATRGLIMRLGVFA